MEGRVVGVRVRNCGGVGITISIPYAPRNFGSHLTSAKTPGALPLLEAPALFFRGHFVGGGPYREVVPD